MGIFTRIWKWLFGSNQPPPPPFLPERLRCSKGYCESFADVRCIAEQCATHCSLYCTDTTGMKNYCRDNKQVNDKVAELVGAKIAEQYLKNAHE